MIYIIIFVLILVYLLSVYGMWKYTSISFSKDGIYYSLDAKATDVFLIFIPLINTMLCISFLTDPPKRKEKEKENNYNKFFKIKK